jgi:maltokinase
VSPKRWVRGGNTNSLDIVTWKKVCDTIGVVIATDGETQYILPITSFVCREKQMVKIDGSTFCEAEYIPVFLKEVLSGKTSLELIKYEELDPESLVFEGSVAEDATNPHVLYSAKNGKLLLKGYRLYRRDNPEALFLRYLSHYNVAPRLVASYSAGGVPLGILVEYIEGGIDPGAPLYSSAKETLATQSITGLDWNILKSIGKAVSIFHNAMLECMEEWCKPSHINAQDISVWRARMKHYLNEIAGVIPSTWLEILNLSLQKYSKRFEAFLDTYKIRIHQDLHFSQMIYKPSGKIYIVDFEGEPGRPPEYNTVLEPALRDIASIARGASYISFYAVKDYYGLSLDNTVKVFQERERPAKQLNEWAQEVLEKIVEEYLRTLSKRLTPTTSPVEALELVFPWMVERALYEANYEKKYRIQNVAVAISTLLSIII